MRQFRSGLFSILSIGLIFSFQLPAAELHKWVDAEGNVNYTQSPPPPGTQGTTIKPPPPVADGASRQQLEHRLDSLDKLTEQRQKQTEQRQKSATEQAEQKRLCEQARSRLASYERPRVSVTGSDGNTRILGEEERTQGLEKARQQVQELCK